MLALSSQYVSLAALKPAKFVKLFLIIKCKNRSCGHKAKVDAKYYDPRCRICKGAVAEVGAQNA